MATTFKINDRTLWTVEDSPGDPVFKITQTVDSEGQLIGLELFTVNTGAGEALDLKAQGAVEVVGNAKIGTLKINGGTIMTNFIGASATLDFPNTAKGESSDLTISVPGAVLGDVVFLGVPAGSTFIDTDYFAFVSSSDTVTVRFNNYTPKVANDPASGTFKVAIIKF